jgi:hypothetical protein
MVEGMGLKLGIEVNFNGMISMLNFINFNQLVHKLSWEYTDKTEW